MNWRWYGRKWSLPTLMCLEGLRNTVRIVSHDSRCPGLSDTSQSRYRWSRLDSAGSVAVSVCWFDVSRREAQLHTLHTGLPQKNASLSSRKSFILDGCRLDVRRGGGGGHLISIFWSVVVKIKNSAFYIFSPNDFRSLAWEPNTNLTVTARACYVTQSCAAVFASYLCSLNAFV
jgi:hypothetical protein